ncbi:15548_t:CDS:2 [Funneliformis geosporum]|uniref:15548_t:CDS:1 n=1 Tax=Funneliformis geosporum TaxID=1117311 RepID=A0A9W4WSS3_9GLOM|nr:15548_t:CDS:2 [Funneliformis geosporum]
MAIKDYLPDFKGALTGFYEENVKETVETKTQEFKHLIQQNAAIGEILPKLTKIYAKLKIHCLRNIALETLSFILAFSSLAVMFAIESIPARDSLSD